MANQYWKPDNILLTFLWVSTHTFKKESLTIPTIEVEQTTQLPKEKIQKDKQWSTNHTHTTE
jgi:hypothetical protein